MLIIDYDLLIDSWNNTLSVLAELAKVPSALVMKVDDNDKIEVFAKSPGDRNPYRLGESEKLTGSGLYCEHVIQHQTTLNIPNALQDTDWNDNPDVAQGIIAYLGLPIANGDESPFGTLCILDNKQHEFSASTLKLLQTIKHNFEIQLKLLHQQHIDDESQQQDELAILIRAIAHELNTPLGVGMTTVSVMQSQLDDIKVKLRDNSLDKASLNRFLDTTEKSTTLLTKNLNNMAKRITTLQDLLANDSCFEKSPCELYPIINNAVASFDKKLTQSHVKYHIDVGNSAGSQTICAPELLQQTLHILCQNSIDHGFDDQPDPQIYIVLSEYNNLLKIHYRDNGKGISPEHQWKIFTPFYTTKQSASCSGLGLSIAKRIVTQQLGGEIIVQPAKIGCSFTISLTKT